METQSPLLAALTREGVLLGVTVRYWRATKKLNAEDLGLDPEKVTQRLISLGHKKLLPQEALAPLALIEGRAHALVEAGTFPFLKGLARYLPNAKLPEVLAGLRALDTEFQTATTRFLEHYAETRDQALAEWTKAAEQLVPEPARLVAAIAAAFPEPARMQRCFEFSLQLYQVKAPEGLDLELVQAGAQEEILRARQQAASEAALQIHRQAEAFVGDCVASLRQQTAQLCEEMLESMRTGKSGVHQKTLNRLARFVEQFKQLNFAGDTQMEAELERVRQAFLQQTAEQYRDDAFARERLTEGLRNLASTARELAQQEARELVERFGVMGQRRFHLQAA